MASVFVMRLGSSEGLARRVLITGTVVGFAALAFIALAAAWVSARVADHTRSVNHTYQVEVEIGRTQALIERTETARRGFVLTGIPSYLDTQRTSAAGIAPALDHVGQLVADNPQQTARLNNLRAWLAEIRAQQDKTIALIQAGRRSEAIDSFTAETTFRRMRTIRAVMTAMLGEERRLLETRDAALQSNLTAFYVILAVAAVLIVLVAAVTLATILRYTRDLRSARDRLQSLNDDLEGAVVERTADLTRANEEIQRFAYIVSHDLRSPLVNVMGFTSELDAARGALVELVDRAEAEAPHIVTDEARMAAREDLPEAIGFIRTSTQKMDRLINAILRLSREGRRTLAPEKLSLEDIAATVRDSLHQLTEERGAEMTVEAPLPQIVGDRLAIEQILSNLVENAVKYLSPDRPGRIVIRGMATHDRAIVEVVDNGRGIADTDHSRIFDLFRRSGMQDQPGEGIGLAHVRALAYRLGGTIDVSSRLGEGSIFRVSLPLTLPETGPTS